MAGRNLVLRALDALDCTHAQYYAANGQHMAWPICARGLAGLADKPRPGPKPKYGPDTALERAPPAGFARRTGRLLAGELGMCMRA